MTINQLKICSKLEEASNLLVKASVLIAAASRDIRQTDHTDLEHDLRSLDVRVDADASDVSFTLGRAEVIAARELAIADA